MSLCVHSYIHYDWVICFIIHVQYLLVQYVGGSVELYHFLLQEITVCMLMLGGFFSHFDSALLDTVARQRKEQGHWLGKKSSSSLRRGGGGGGGGGASSSRFEGPSDVPVHSFGPPKYAQSLCTAWHLYNVHFFIKLRFLIF